LILNMFRSIL